MIFGLNLVELVSCGLVALIILLTYALARRARARRRGTWR